MVSKEIFKLVSQFKKRVNTLPLDNQRTSVCCKSVTWSLPISLHSAENTQEFRGLALTKVTIFTVLSKIYFKLSGIPLAARASQWMLQCTQVVSGETACMQVTTPLCLPVMAFAPSVQIPTHIDHQSPFDVTKLSSTLKISSPVVLISNGLQKRMSFLIDPP